VAGSFYPAEPGELTVALRAAMAEAVRAHGADASAPKAVVVPHAGYVYSGPVAASAYRRLATAKARISRVVVLGPSHRVPVAGLAVSGADGFATPLGVIPVDVDGREALLAQANAVVDDRPHRLEHSLEVQLPFLQTVLGEFVLLPVAVGRADPDEVGVALARVWDDANTVVVVSTDLSHYLDYDLARERDRRTAAAVCARDETAIDDSDACGAYPLRGLLRFAREHNLPVRQLDLRSSGDTAGDRRRVVGYGAFAVG
jgi:AmmeMemoRadiSam system protein B